MERWSPNEALSHPFITGHAFPPMFKPIFDQSKLRYKDPEPPTSKPPLDRTFIQPLPPSLVYIKIIIIYYSYYSKFKPIFLLKTYLLH